MAEAVGLAASIIAVLDVAQKLAVMTRKYIKSYKNAPEEIKTLCDELVSLIGVLQMLRVEAEDDSEDSDESSSGTKSGDPLPQSLAIEGGPLWLCENVLRDIMEKLGKSGEKIHGIKRILWPFKDGEMKDHLTKLERAKSILNLALTASENTVTKEIRKLCKETRKNTAATLEVVKQIQKDQKETKDDREERKRIEKQKEVTRWLLNGVDYESNHDQARNLHQAGTGDWFLTGNDFPAWLKGDKKRLWLYGIPGAGKTILMSTIISKTKEQLPVGDAACAYFYFSFRDSKKQTTDTMLSCVLSQICEQLSPFPESVIKLYEDLENKNRRPYCNELLANIKEACALHKRVYIFLDALDEATREQHTDLFDGIQSLCGIEDLHLIATSRNEVQIESRLKDLAFMCLSIQTKAVNHDIRLFLDTILHKDPVLNRYANNERLKNEILTKLVDGAQGMFRWVECQLDTLRSCRTPAQVLSALETLPPTLYGTYDRIIYKTSEQDRVYLRRAIAWIIWGMRGLSPLELAEAMIIEPGTTCFNDDYRFGDPNDKKDYKAIVENVKSICGPLITISWKGPVIRDRDWLDNAPIVQLAHYSVQEYFTSNRLRCDEILKPFHLGSFEGNELIIEACFTYLQWEGIADEDLVEQRNRHYWVRKKNNVEEDDKPGEANVICEPFHLYGYFVTRWHAHVKRDPRHEDLLYLKASKFFRTDEISSCYITWQNYILAIDGMPWQRLDTIGGPLYQAASHGFATLTKQMLEKGADAHVEGGGLGYPLHIAAHKGHIKIVELLIEQGGVNLGTDRWRVKGSLAIHCAVIPENINMIRFILDNCPGCINERDKSGRTPLLIAALNIESTDIYRLLLEKGADPNLPVKPLKFTKRMPPPWLWGRSPRDADFILGDFLALPLHIRVNSVDSKTVKVLIEGGADVNKPDPFDELSAIARVTQPLFQGKLYSPNSSEDRESMDEVLAIIEALLDNGADLQIGACPVSPLRLQLSLMATDHRRDRTDDVIALIEKGADVNERHDISGVETTHSPFMVAANCGFTRVADKMREHGANKNDLKDLEKGAYIKDDSKLNTFLTDRDYDTSRSDNDSSEFVKGLNGDLWGLSKKRVKALCPWRWSVDS